MARILHIAHGFPPTLGGVETHLWDISQRLSRRGHTIVCLVGGPRGCDQFRTIEVRRFPELTVASLLQARSATKLNERNQCLMRALQPILRDTNARAKPAIVHVHNGHHFAPELAEACFEEFSDEPLLNSVHDRVGEHVYPAVLELPWSHTFFASHYLAQSFPSCKGARSVIWLGIDHERFTPFGAADLRLLQLERPIIMHPARLLHWKGPHISVEAFVKLRHDLRRGSLVLCESKNVVDDSVGVAALRQELRQRATFAGVSEHLHFMDFGAEQMANAYRASDLVWYPTIDEEPFGLVPIEAMACGVPVVVSNSGGMRETTEHGVNGLVVKKGDASDLAAASLMILTQDDLRKRIITGGLSRAREFDASLYVQRLEGVYTGLKGEISGN